MIVTDLVQSGILKKNGKCGFFKKLLFVVMFRSVRVHVAIRCLKCNYFVKKICTYYLRRKNIEIGSNVEIGGYFFLPHPMNIIIANGVVIGEHVHIGQNVTIGGNFKKTMILDNDITQKLPIIGSRVMVSANSVIGGPVVIGDDVIIGANSTITKNISSNKIASGRGDVSKRNIVVLESGGSYKTIS
ncbi:hypothetical protein AYI87_17690 [Shewanella sp. KCT]|nr:hypothetical protein AYI87_17690 [Shewanella sp. KCT]